MNTDTSLIAINYVFSNNLTGLRNLSDDMLKQKDPDGRTCVHAACCTGNSNILRYLIENQNCNPHEPYVNGYRPVHYACGYNWSETLVTNDVIVSPTSSHMNSHGDNCTIIDLTN